MKEFLLFLQDISMCTHASVSLHLIGMSSQAEMFSVHMNGQVLTHNGHKVSSVGLISGSTATVSMVALHPGRWMLSSHTFKHIEGQCCTTFWDEHIWDTLIFLAQLTLYKHCFLCSWHAWFCGCKAVWRLSRTQPEDDCLRKTRQHAMDILHSCWGSYLGLFTQHAGLCWWVSNISKYLSVTSKYSIFIYNLLKLQLCSLYQVSLTNFSFLSYRDFKLQYLTQSSTRVGARYKKAVYTLYTNESFTEKLVNKQRKNELGIIGPVIRAQIRDVIKVRL